QFSRGPFVAGIGKADVGPESVEVSHLPEDGESRPSGHVVTVFLSECVPLSPGHAEPGNMMSVHKVNLPRSRAAHITDAQQRPVTIPEHVPWIGVAVDPPMPKREIKTRVLVK